VRHDDIGEQQINVPGVALLFQAQGFNAIGCRQNRVAQSLTMAAISRKAGSSSTSRMVSVPRGKSGDQRGAGIFACDSTCGR
jgi:hypothetical protein